MKYLYYGALILLLLCSLWIILSPDTFTTNQVIVICTLTVGGFALVSYLYRQKHPAKRTYPWVGYVYFGAALLYAGYVTVLYFNR